MSYTCLLINTCDIYRNTPGVVDDYGQPTASWAAIATDEACRLVSHSGKEIEVGAEVVIANYTLFLGDLDITEQDRIFSDLVTYEILLVTNRQDGVNSHHKECFMRTVR